MIVSPLNCPRAKNINGRCQGWWERGKLSSRGLLDLTFRTCALNTKIVFILAITQRGCPLANLQLLLGKHRKEHNSPAIFVAMVPVFTEMQLSRKLKFFRGRAPFRKSKESSSMPVGDPCRGLPNQPLLEGKPMD